MVTTNDLQRQNVNAELVARAIAWAYQDERVLSDPDYSLHGDPLFWEKLQRDPVSGHAIEQRQVSVAGQNFNVMAGGRYPRDVDHGVAVAMEEMLDQIQCFTEARLQLVDAVFVGEAWQFVQTERRRIVVPNSRGENVAIEMLVPVYLEPIDKRQIRSVVEQPDPAQPYVVRYEYMDPARKEWVRLPDDAIIVHWAHKDRPTRFGHGQGMNESLFFPQFAQSQIFRHLLQSIDRWSQGVVVAKVSRDGEAQSEKTNEQIRDDYIAMLKKHRTDGVFAMDKEDELDVLWPGGTGYEMLTRAIDYYDRVKTQRILGAVLPTGGAAGDGSRARAEVESESTETLVQFDRLMMDDVYSRDLVAPLWRLNRAAFAELGFADARCPRLSCTHERRVDPLAFAQLAEIALRSGAPIIKSEYYGNTGLTQPGEHDEVLQGLPMQDANALIGAGLPSLPGSRDPVGARSSGGEREEAA